MKYSTFEKDIFRQIGYYYLNKNEKKYMESSNSELTQEIEDSIYKDTREQLVNLGIQRIEIESDPNAIKIYLSRPGLLIGEKGQNITALQEHLSSYFATNISIKIVEDNLINYLIPVNPQCGVDAEYEYENDCF